MFPDICRYRTETALAETRVSCFVLKRERMEEVSKSQPAFAKKLKEICAIKAVHYGFSNAAVEALVKRESASRSFSRMDLTIEKLKGELLAEYEAKLQRMGFSQPGQERGPVYQVWLHQHGGGDSHELTRDGVAYSRRHLPSDNDGLTRHSPSARDEDQVERDRWTKVSCTFTESGQMLYIAHDLAALRVGRVSSLGILKDVESETGDVSIDIASLSPGCTLQTKGVSFLLAATGCHSFRRVTATLEDPEQAAEFLRDLRNVLESQRESKLNGNIGILQNIDLDLTPKIVDGSSLGHQKLAEDFEDQTSSPPSEFEAGFLRASAFQNDVKRLTAAYADASPAMRIIMEELHKLRAENTRQAQRQEALHKEVERALSSGRPRTPKGPVNHA